jgi:molecular chaperone GrpE
MDEERTSTGEESTPAQDMAAAAEATVERSAGTELQAHLEEAAARLAQAEDAQRRLAADFANYRRRVDRDRSEWEATARGDLLLRLLPVFDNLRRARQAAGQSTADTNDAAGALLTGLDMVIRGLDEALMAVGLTESVAVGDAFDPVLCEAIGQEERDDIEPGHVSEVLQSGYRLGERVLRPALVRVATAAAGAAVPGGGSEGGA